MSKALHRNLPQRCALLALAIGLCSPLEHRVLDFTRLDPMSGAREPIGSSERRVPHLNA